MGHRGQGTIEYTLAFIAVTFAIIAMAQYLKLAAGGRIKSSTDSLTSTLFSPDGGQLRFQNCQENYSRSVGIGGAHSKFFIDESREAALLPDPADPSASLNRLPDCAFGDLDPSEPDEG